MEKQIEEIKQLARDIYERGTALDGIDFVHAAVNGADDDPESHFMRIARHLHVTKGYRKASDVAREIFAEIIEALTEERITEYQKSNSALEAQDTTSYEVYSYAEDKLATIITALKLYKKKYESEEKNENQTEL